MNRGAREIDKTKSTLHVERWPKRLSSSTRSRAKYNERNSTSDQEWGEGSSFSLSAAATHENEMMSVMHGDFNFIRFELELCKRLRSLDGCRVCKLCDALSLHTHGKRCCSSSKNCLIKCTFNIDFSCVSIRSAILFVELFRVYLHCIIEI